MTRHELEADILEIAANGMTLTSISTAADEDGDVPALNSAIREGLRSVGVTPAARTVTDADLAGLTASQQDQVRDVAILHIFDRIFLNWNRINVSDNGSSQSWGSLLDSLTKRADWLRKRVESVYGLGDTGISVGTMSLGLIESGDDEDEC